MSRNGRGLSDFAEIGLREAEAAREDQQRMEDAARQVALEYTRQRAEITTQGIRSLLLINGGGAAALLAFLQAIWNEDPALAEHVVTAIAWLAGGVVVAGASFFLRYHTSFAMQQYGRESKWYKFLSYMSVFSWYVSLAAFVMGLYWVVTGASDLIEIAKQSTAFYVSATFKPV